MCKVYVTVVLDGAVVVGYFPFCKWQRKIEVGTTLDYCCTFHFHSEGYTEKE